MTEKKPFRIRTDFIPGEPKPDLPPPPKDWNNVDFSCHICARQKDCDIRTDLWDFVYKHLYVRRSQTGRGLEDETVTIGYLETDLARFCRGYLKEGPRKE